MSRSELRGASSRAEAAAATRVRIVAAATEEFLRAGFHGTSIAAVASAAGVSPQTIYNSVGGKAALLKAAYDVLLVGDAEPVPMDRRPEIQAVRTQPDARATLVAYAHVGRVVYDRVGPLLGAVVTRGPGADTELADFLATIDRERGLGARGVVGHVEETFGLPDGLDAATLRDHLWTLSAPDVWDRLVRRCGWTPDDYERWLGGQFAAGLEPGRGARSRS